MKNLSIKTRLLGLVAALLVLLIISAVATVYRMRQSNAVLATVYNDRVVPLEQLKEVADGYFIGMVDTAHKTRDGLMKPEDGLKALAHARQTIDKHWKAYLATELIAEEKALVAKTEPAMKAADAAAETLAGLLGKNDIEGLRAFTAREMYPAVDPLADKLNQLTKVQLSVAEKEYRQSQADYEGVIWRNALISGVTVLVAGTMAWLLVGAIVRGIAQAVKVAETVAAGNLGSRIEVTSRDETGQLMAALKRMNESLVAVVGQVRNASDSIATGSAQIATGNADLSQRTEEQAANLEQTAASMEQLTATVQSNADSAREAAALSSKASASAGQGGEVVNQVVTTMGRISESSRRIGDITGVIDGIAFQTNILSLNAAVEAARAGEQGRGFAVVASEVRSLAQRSAEAAREIKKLIETSMEQVRDGNRQAAAAGETMGQIVDQVARVSTLVNEISTASVEQSGGVSQVSDAVAQLDQVTQQNAALVEEAAAAAESMNQQAQRLTETVAVFRVS
ncbi:MAG TPA: methyl-accepting chemotaxis protein [Rhizobacter sp.]|nr:methyl-accepting chemotaxis protein [Rhizobacter sp.]